VRRLLLLVLVVATVVLTAGAAHAHGDTGFFELEAAEPAGPSVVRYDVLLRFQNDGDPVDGATVRLTATGPDGASVGPLPMTPGGEAGRYETTVTFPGPGVWGVRVESVDPAAVLEHVETVGAPTTTTTASTVPSSTTTEVDTVASTGEDDGEGGGVRPGSMIAVGIAAVAIAFVLRRQRDRQRAGS
jgi:hypothetical protein